MKFTIETLNDNGSGMKYASKEEFLKEISMMIDDCIANGGTFFDVQVDSDESCFLTEEDDDVCDEDVEDDFLSELAQEATEEETIEIWLADLLESTGKTSIDDLTKEELQREIEDIKGTIDNEAVWALSDPIHNENIKEYRHYLKKLEEMKGKAKT